MSHSGKRLTDRQRQRIKTMFAENYSIRSIAAIVECSPTTVKKFRQVNQPASNCIDDVTHYAGIVVVEADTIEDSSMITIAEMPVFEPLLNTADAAKAVGLKRPAMQRLIRAGKFPQPIRMGDKLWRFRAYELKAYCDGEWIANGMPHCLPEPVNETEHHEQDLQA